MHICIHVEILTLNLYVWNIDFSVYTFVKVLFKNFQEQKTIEAQVICVLLDLWNAKSEVLHYKFYSQLSTA